MDSCAEGQMRAGARLIGQRTVSSSLSSPGGTVGTQAMPIVSALSPRRQKQPRAGDCDCPSLSEVGMTPLEDERGTNSHGRFSTHAANATHAIRVRLHARARACLEETATRSPRRALPRPHEPLTFTPSLDAHAARIAWAAVSSALLRVPTHVAELRSSTNLRRSCRPPNAAPSVCLVAVPGRSRRSD